jgi:hypothetical protein
MGKEYIKKTLSSKIQTPFRASKPSWFLYLQLTVMTKNGVGFGGKKVADHVL